MLIGKRIIIQVELPEEGVVFIGIDQFPIFFAAGKGKQIAPDFKHAGLFSVENSIRFRGVKVAPNARVNNCIIMQDGQVQEGAYIENCILDKQTVIKRNTRLIGPEAYPIVIAKNVVI